MEKKDYRKRKAHLPPCARRKKRKLPEALISHIKRRKLKVTDDVYTYFDDFSHQNQSHDVDKSSVCVNHFPNAAMGFPEQQVNDMNDATTDIIIEDNRDINECISKPLPTDNDNHDDNTPVTAVNAQLYDQHSTSSSVGFVDVSGRRLDCTVDHLADDLISDSEIDDAEVTANSTFLDTHPGNEESFDELFIVSESNISTGANMVEGRRIVNLPYLLNSIQELGNHGSPICTFADMIFVSEKTYGLYSALKFQCKMCNYVKVIYTEDPKSPDTMNVNEAAVSGIIATGGGYSQLEEICAALNMPRMSDQTWKKYHEKISETVHEAAWKLMIEAGQEEKRLAIERGDIDKDGIPLITVVGDASWSQRSYGTNYDALSGQAALFGYETKRPLYIGMRNKYCSYCFRHKGGQIPEHKCAMNWTGSSTAMEADIIVEGFRQSIDMHGVKYNKLIADGDSSVYNKLVDAMPYGHNLPIQKIECRNHILRNYGKKLRDLAANRKVGTGLLRNELKKNILRLRTAVIAAIKYRKKQVDQSVEIKIQELKKDILNSPCHVFGEHSSCAERNYFCDGKQKPGEVNLVPELRKTGMFSEIMSALQFVVKHSNSLILDVDNNISENFNSIVAKTIGGKRVNFSLRNSFQTRCELAIASANSNCDLHRVIHKTSVNKSPGKHTKMFIKRRKNRMDSCRKRRLHFGKKGRKESAHKIQQPEIDYGPHLLNAAEDMPEEVLSKAMDDFLQKLNNEDKEEIEKNTRDQSASFEWKKQRALRVTASNFGEICHMRPTTSPEKLVYRIRYKGFKGNEHTRWGILKEAFALEQFCKETKLAVERCGLIIDQHQPYFAASPDGLISNDGIVEVKCPSSAKEFSPYDAVLEKKIKFLKITDGKLSLKRNDNYFYQIQGQLHITKRDICYFVVWTPLGIFIEEIRRDENFWSQNMEGKLKNFYMKHLLPEIIDSRIDRNLPLRK